MSNINKRDRVISVHVLKDVRGYTPPSRKETEESAKEFSSLDHVEVRLEKLNKIGLDEIDPLDAEIDQLEAKLADMKMRRDVAYIRHAEKINRVLLVRTHMTKLVKTSETLEAQFNRLKSSSAEWVVASNCVSMGVLHLQDAIDYVTAVRNRTIDATGLARYMARSAERAK